MTSNLSIIKRVSVPFAQLFPFIPKQKNIRENIDIYTGVQKIPYSFSGACNELGVLSLARNKTENKLELYFTPLTDKETMWMCTLDQFDQLKRPRSNLLCVETDGIATLFKFSDPEEAQKLYDAVNALQSTVKVIYKNDVEPPIGWAEGSSMQTKPKETQSVLKGKPSTISKLKENRKLKLTKQKSIKDSFKSIISAAKRVKDMEKAKFTRKPSKEDDETFPLVL